MRKAGWWWAETEFDCSKFVLWVLAGRKIGDPQLAAGEAPEKAIRKVTAAPFGRVSDASAVRAMVPIVEGLVGEGKASPIGQDRTPQVGDLMFWGGHVAIVVDVQPVVDTGDSWVVYANMGTTTGAGLVTVKASEVPKLKNLALGDFKGYWTP
jgi:cell wall-associated NlpC family hydrolase